MASLPTVKDIVKNAKDRESAIADYNSHSLGGNKLNYNDFNAELDKKFPTKGGNKLTNFIGEGTNKLAGLAEAGEKQTSFPENKVTLADGINKVGNILDKLSKLDFGGALKEIGGTLENQILTFYKEQNALLEKINAQAGLTGEFAKNVREELTRTSPELALIGISFQDLAESAKSVVDDSGKFLTLNRTTWKETGLAATAYVGTLSDLVRMFPEFEKVGIGAGDVAGQIEKVGKRSIELGLQSQKTTKELNTNLSKLNEYGFKNGVQGLAEMVRKSTELRMNMGEVFKIADKVFEPEGAIEMTASLQAVGGAIGDFNDPLKLMYMATNNVEGLGVALEGVASSLATYNQEQGRFEITGVNIRRARELAKGLGIDYGELTKVAIASAQRTSAAADLMAKGLTLDEDQKRFITNIATMKDGKMQIELQSDKLQTVFRTDRIALEDLSQEQVDQLVKLQDEFKEMDTVDIVKKQASEVENINRNLTFITAVARQRAMESGESVLKKIAETFKIDLGSVIKQTEKKTQEVGRSMLKPEGINTPTKLETKVEPQTSLDMSKMRESVQQQQTPVTSTINHNHTYTIKSDSTVVDSVGRGIINSPSLLNNFIDVVNPSKRDYISSPTIMNA